MPKGVYARKPGLKRTPRGGSYTATCLHCQKSFAAFRSNARKFCSKSCYRLYTRGDKSPVFKGGYVDTHGYKVLCIDGQRITEHRHVLGTVLGRTLTTQETVHHIDGDKLNNSLDNLVVLSHSTHAELHTRMANLFIKRFPEEARKLALQSAGYAFPELPSTQTGTDD